VRLAFLVQMLNFRTIFCIMHNAEAMSSAELSRNCTYFKTPSQSILFAFIFLFLNAKSN